MADDADVVEASALGHGTTPPRANVRALDFLTYRGGVGMAAWLLHRLTGLGVLVFLCLHVLDTSLIGWGPAAYNEAIRLYRQTFFRIGEMALFGAVLFHALNGIRITIMDYWPQTCLRQRPLFYGVAAAFVVLFLPALVAMALWMR